MISLLGFSTLFLAFSAALFQGILPLLGYYRQNPYLLAIARPAALAQCSFVIAAYALLTYAFAINDFTLTYVAANSHPLLPLMYRLTAVWGAHEGSILLWILVLNIWSVVFSFTTLQSNPKTIIDARTRALTLAILGILNACFLSFLIFTSNPFIASTVLLAGHDLNPLLQDPGFVIHPPMLYIGYVGFSVAFAITLAALLRGKLNTAWAHITKQYAIAAWLFLTFGITLGSWWAYRVLGWGGFWFWDPVENASLLPWIAGTALIHVLVLAEKRNAAKSWGAFLALICFALSLLGTFLVRSGVLISAHTFANDPARGVYLLVLLALLLTASLTIYITRIGTITDKPIAPFEWLSREGSLLLNSNLLFVAMLTVLLGTLYPLIIDALKLGTISVGAPYFNIVMAPLVFITMFFMGFGPHCRWQSQSFTQLIKSTWKKLCISLLAAVALLGFYTHHFDYTAILCIALSIWIVLSILNYIRILPAMALAHTGFAVLIIGIMLSSVLNVEREVRIKPGDSATVGPYQFLFIDIAGVNGSNYRGIVGEFEVTKGERHIVNMYPEKLIYTVRDMVMTKVDIHPGLFRDLYIALGEPLEQNYWSVRIYYKPFIRWIWIGGILMMLGGLLALIKE